MVTFVARAAAHRQQQHDIESDAPGAGHTADHLLKELAGLESTLSQIRDAQDFRLVSQGPDGHAGPGSYRALMTEIESLHAQAEILRNAEAAKAVEWIRDAISAYGLTARDLGFR